MANDPKFRSSSKAPKGAAIQKTPGLPLPGGENTGFSSIFTIKPGTSSNITDGHTVPSITALLERKKLSVNKKAPSSSASAPAPAVRKKPKIEPARRRNSNELPLVEWKSVQLSETADPLGNALLVLFDAGVETVLYLGRENVITPDGSMKFTAKAYSGKSTRLTLWKGLNWHSTEFDHDLWSDVLEGGYLEITPDSHFTDPQDPRRALREFSGALPDEHLTLFRVGQPELCRGLILTFAPRAITSFCRDVVKLLSRPVGGV